LASRDAAAIGDNRLAAFELDADQTMILDEADRFARKELYPLSARMDAEEWWPEDAFEKIGAQGLFGVTVAPEYGGAGLDLVAAGLVMQAFSRWNHAMALSCVAHDNLCANNIYRNGNDEQRRKYLPDLCAGRKIGALGLTEPGAGSDALGSMRTTARREGDHYVLNGGKIYITNGPVADVLLVYAKTDRDKGAHGISAFIVEKEFPGFKVAQKLEKMGYRGSQTGELVFEECRVPAENLVGGENRGVAVVMSGLDLERAMISPLCLGIAERALELSLDYAKTRQQFGKPIGSFQMVQDLLAKMIANITASQCLLVRMSQLQAEGKMTDAHAALSKAFTTAKCRETVAWARELLGGNGIAAEYNVGRFFADSEALYSYEGTYQMQNLIIGKAVTGFSAFV
jgi:isovaleryl-CoA dehydrogenase